MSTWTKEYRCVKCAKVLTYNQISRSHGFCPFCGHVSTGTICDTVQKAIHNEPGTVSSFILRWSNWWGPVLGTATAFTMFLAIKSCEREEMPKPQTVLNLDEMARKWNATSPYFLATSNRVTVQDTTSYGITTLRIDPK